jgi:hypothetical protein
MSIREDKRDTEEKPDANVGVTARRTFLKNAVLGVGGITASVAVAGCSGASAGSKDVTSTIAFTVANHTYGDEPFDVSASTNSTGAITYTVVSGPATISGSTVTITGVGTVVLQAAVAADANYTADTQQATFTVAAGKPTILFTVPNLTYGDAPFDLAATSNSTGAFTYTVTSGPATIAGVTVTLTGPGTVVLAAAQAAAGNYAAATQTATFTVAAGAPANTQIPTSAAWKFGIMADSQWYQADDGKNPFSVAVDIRNHVIQQMINNKVKFVAHVGDLTSNASNSGSSGDIYGHALFCQDLYNAGIGYFTIRGNHEDSADCATALQTAFPQTQTGMHNSAPSAVTALANPDPSTLPTPVNTGAPFALGTNFSSPDPWGTGDLKGLSYSFDYNNARFVALDQFTVADAATNSAYSITTSISAQQPWIASQLSGRAAGSHAFVLAHKGLVLPYHTDVLLGSNPGQNVTATDTFMSTLASNGVRYLICGHDHVHDRSIVTASDGKSSSINQLVASSNSNYCYLPRNTTTFPGDVLNDSYNAVPRRSIAAQETNTLGYYIVTVDGNNVTFEFYSSPSYQAVDLSQHQWDYQYSTSIPVTPPLNFTLRETFGYSLVGKQFQVPFNSPFTVVSDKSPNGTTVQLLSGKNAVQDTDYSGLQYVRSISTGWAAGSGAQISDVLYLWGIHSSLVTMQSETYAVQMSYPAGVDSGLLSSGKVYIAAIGDSGIWVNAVNANYGGTTNFVQGPWNSSYALGTYGVDPANNVAWAVLNYEGIFAVSLSS